MDWFLYDRDHRHERVNFHLTCLNLPDRVYFYYQKEILKAIHHV